MPTSPRTTRCILVRPMTLTRTSRVRRPLGRHRGRGGREARQDRDTDSESDYEIDSSTNYLTLNVLKRDCTPAKLGWREIHAKADLDVPKRNQTC